MSNKAKKMAQQIIVAILQGAHTPDMIMRNRGIYTEYKEFCEAMAALQIEGIIECHNRNMAHEWGYYLTDKGMQSI